MTTFFEHYVWPGNQAHRASSAVGTSEPGCALERTVRLNILLGSHGELVGSDGTSASLSTPTDRALLRFIRADADVVIVGGTSVRSEGWFLPPHGQLVVLSGSQNLPWESCPDASRVHVAHSARELSDHLEATTGNVLCEGGPRLAATIENLIGFDELAISLIHPACEDPLRFLGLNPVLFTRDFELSDPRENITFQFWRRATGL